MKQKFLFNFVFLVFFIKIVYAEQKKDSFTQEIEKARQNTQLNFKTQADLIQYCTQEMNSASLQASFIKNNISEINNNCHHLDTEDQINECISSKETVLKKMKNLAQTVSKIQTHCFTDFSLNRMAHSINALEKDLMIFQGRYTRWTQSREQDKQEEYQNRPLLCSLDLGFRYRQMIDWDTQIKIASLAGDVHTFNKGVSAITVLNDYIQILAELCVQEEPDNPLSQSTTALVQEIQKRTQKSQELANQTTDQINNVDLDQWPKKWCSQQKNTTSQAVKELCRNPLNNPSWTYSAYYFSRLN